jgi:integrase
MRLMGYIAKEPKTGKYLVRIVIPPALRRFFPNGKGGYKTALQQSLGTRSKDDANARAHPVIRRFKAMLAKAREAADASSTVDDVPLAFRVADEWKREDARRYEAERYRAMTAPDPASRGLFLHVSQLNRRNLLERCDSPDKLPPPPAPPRLVGMTASGECIVEEELWEPHPLEEALSAHGIGRDHPAYRVCFDLLRAEMLATTEERLRQLASAPRNARSDHADQLSSPAEPVPLSIILDAWRKERCPAEKTNYQWRRTLKKLTDFVGHEDAARITRADITRWKDELIAAGELDHRTIENHLIVVRRIFRYAHQNMHLLTNPAEFVVFKAKDNPSNDKRGFTDEEARLILTLARSEREAHKRWVPWLAAFTGARCDELCGAIAADIHIKDGFPAMRIDPAYRGEGATVKNRASVRTVPLHPAIIKEGFLDYAGALPSDGPLFPKLTPDRFGKRGGNGSKTLGRWVRQKVGIVDPRIQPNHAWRHRFEDEGKRHGIPREIRFLFEGHALDTAGDDYGSGNAAYSMAALARWIAMLPCPVP